MGSWKTSGIFFSSAYTATDPVRLSVLIAHLHDSLCNSNALMVTVDDPFCRSGDASKPVAIVALAQAQMRHNNNPTQPHPRGLSWSTCSNLPAMASNQETMASNLLGMASNQETMASNLLGMASNLQLYKSLRGTQNRFHHTEAPSLQSHTGISHPQ